MNNIVTIFLSVLVLVLLIFNWTGFPVLCSQILETEELILVTQDTFIPQPQPARKIDDFAKETQPFLLSCKNAQNRRKCVGDYMINFIETHLEYPILAKEAHVEGTAVIAFFIEEDGSMTDFKIVRDPGEGLGYEALRIIKLLANKGAIWMPFRRGGQPIRWQYYIPVKFKLNE